VKQLVIALVVLASLATLASPAGAKGTKRKNDAAPTVSVDDDGAKKSKKARVFEFGAFGIEGSMRTPQLLYFLGRVKRELDRASLEKRSFMPELVRSVEQGGM
jgi:hypothetical protein